MKGGLVKGRCVVEKVMAVKVAVEKVEELGKKLLTNGEEWNGQGGEGIENERGRNEIRLVRRFITWSICIRLLINIRSVKRVQ